MSIVAKESIHIIAQSIGLSNLQDDVAAALAPDVEYRMREIMQEAIKSMRHSKRSVLTTDDVSCALSLRNVEPLYRYASSDPLRFKREASHPDIYYIDDRDLEFKEVVDTPLPKAPLETSVVVHWLAVEGVQPAIPENAPIEGFAVPQDTKKPDAEAPGRKDEDIRVDVKASVKHVLSRELQLYFAKITELILNGAEPSLLKAALASLATDSGLHSLVPYFTQFISDEVTRSLDEFPLLFSLMRAVQSLLLNPHIHLEPYLHQLMPAVITCLVAKRLGGNSLEDHWPLRDFTASIVAFICRRFGSAYLNLQPRVTRTLLHAFMDPKRAITQQYGAIQGLAALGPRVVRLLVLPNLETYILLLAPEMDMKSQPNEIKRYEALRVYGALLRAAGDCLYEKFRTEPELLLATSSIVMKTSDQVAMALEKPDLPTRLAAASAENLARKRPATGELRSQSGEKKIHTHPSVSDSQALPSGDGSVVDVEMTSMDALVASNPESAEVKSRSSSDRQEDGKKTRQSLVRNRIVLPDAVKEDAEAGPLLGSMVDFFGEAMIPFIPLKELSLTI